MCNVKDDRTGSMMPVILEHIVDGTKSKKTGRRVSHMPDMAGDGTSVLGLSRENQNNTEHNVVGKTKKSRTLRSQNKKHAAKIDSDLEIVAEMSGDSDGQKFEKIKNSKQNESGLELELNLKTRVESSEDDLDSDLDKHRVLLVQNGSEKKKIDAVAKKITKKQTERKYHTKKRSELSRRKMTFQ